MASGSNFRPLGLTFSILGLIQGLLWLCMSLIGILIYAEVFYKNLSFQNTIINYIIIYIRQPGDDGKKGFKILVFLIIYFILSLYWTGISCNQLLLFKKLKLASLKNVLYQWIAVACLLSVIDLALIGVVLKDYFDFIEIAPLLNIDTVLIILLLVASRGIVIWLANVSGIFVCIVLVKKVKDEEIKQSRYNDSVQAIQAFDHLEASPSPWYTEVVNDENPVPRISHVNPGFISDEMQGAENYSRQTSYEPKTMDSPSIYGRQMSYEPKTMDNPSIYGRQMSYDPNTIDNYIDQEFRYINQDDDARSRNFQNGDNRNTYDNNNYNYPNDWDEQNGYNRNSHGNGNNVKRNQQNSNYNSQNRNSNYENQRPVQKKPIKVLDMELIPDEELEPPIIPPPDYTPPNTPLVRARPVLKSNPIYQ